MITWRLLDISALLDAATGRTVYSAPWSWPPRARHDPGHPGQCVGRAWALAPEEARTSLSLVGEHPHAVPVDLDGGTAERVGLPAREAGDRGPLWSIRGAHVVAVGPERG